MTPTTTNACPKCRQPIQSGSKFCQSCGNDISGVWGPGEVLGGTIAVEVDPNVDTLGQLLSEATLGDYDIYGELGRGGMAAVYLGLDMALNRKVAIKTMLPELVAREGMVARFKREAQTSAALSHPHIIQIYTVKETPKLVYFVMKFIEGRSLESVITDKGQVPLEMTQVIINQVGSALAFAHRKSVVHRDIKPANIMIDEEGWAIVTDFGIAKVQEAQNLTATGTAIGTPHYMSPEQFHNKAVTGASDQYSLGIVVYEMLTGRKPFDGGTYAEIITQHLFEPPPDLRTVRPDVPEHVAEVIKKMMAKDPLQRFPDCEAAAHALGAPATKQGGDAVRTQMISMAKSGPQKKVRMSVPMSPIPVSKQPQTTARTAIEPKAQAKTQQKSQRPKPQPAEQEEKTSSGAGKWIGIAAAILILAGGGFFGYTKFMKPQTPTEKVAVVPAGTPEPVKSAPATQPTDSAAPAPVAAAPNVDSLVELAAQRLADRQRKATADSLKKAEAAAARAAKSKPPVIATKSAVAETKTETKKAEPVAEKVAEAPKPAPVPTKVDSGSVRIGSPTPGAFLYIEGVVGPALTGVSVIKMKAGQIHLAIKAEGCQTWDSTFTLAPDAVTTVGRRPLKCP